MNAMQGLRHLLARWLLVWMGLCACHPALAFDYGSIDPGIFPPAGWQNYSWQDPGGWTTINVGNQGLPANNPAIDASEKIRDILSSTGGNRILYFPQGTYYFKTDLTITSSRIRFQGDGRHQTTLLIDVPASARGEIKFAGQNLGAPLAVSGSPARADQSIFVDDASTLNPGDFVQIYLQGGLLFEGVYTESQILRIEAKNGNALQFDMKLGLDYPAAKLPRLQKLQMIRDIAVQGLKIVRQREPDQDGIGNLLFERAHNVLVRDIESAFTERFHIDFSFSKNSVVYSNFIHDNFGGGGGHGYGISIRNGSTGIRATHNKLWNLRHHIILQKGANHNVISYNSVEANYKSYNDLAFHASHAYMNLIEGNAFNEGYADNSKWENPNARATGPRNTWFRNRALDNVGSENSATKQQNVIGNSLASVSTSGTGHYLAANRQSDGTVLWGSLAGNSNIPSSLYLTSKPSFFGTKPWPIFGPGVHEWGAANTLAATDAAR